MSHIHLAAEASAKGERPTRAGLPAVLLGWCLALIGCGAPDLQGLRVEHLDMREGPLRGSQLHVTIATPENLAHFQHEHGATVGFSAWPCMTRNPGDYRPMDIGTVFTPDGRTWLFALDAGPARALAPEADGWFRNSLWIALDGEGHEGAAPRPRSIRDISRASEDVCVRLEGGSYFRRWSSPVATIPAAAITQALAR